MESLNENISKQEKTKAYAYNESRITELSKLNRLAKKEKKEIKQRTKRNKGPDGRKS